MGAGRLDALGFPLGMTRRENPEQWFTLSGEGQCLLCIGICTLNRILCLFLKGEINSITTRHFHLCLVLVVAAFPFHSVVPKIGSFNVLFTCLTQVTPQKLFLVQAGAASSLKVACTWSCAAVPCGSAYASSFNCCWKCQFDLGLVTDRSESSSSPHVSSASVRSPSTAESKVCAVEAPYPEIGFLFLIQ